MEFGTRQFVGHSSASCVGKLEAGREQTGCIIQVLAEMTHNNKCVEPINGKVDGRYSIEVSSEIEHHFLHMDNEYSTSRSANQVHSFLSSLTRQEDSGWTTKLRIRTAIKAIGGQKVNNLIGRWNVEIIKCILFSHIFFVRFLSDVFRAACLLNLAYVVCVRIFALCLYASSYTSLLYSPRFSSKT